MYICVDFDGTVVEHEFPAVGPTVFGAVSTLQALNDAGAKLILFTMRSGEHLTDAVNWFKENEIELFGVNVNPTQKRWTDSPKAYGNVYIDDAALGCPLIHGASERPYVDWKRVREMIFGAPSWAD